MWELCIAMMFFYRECPYLFIQIAYVVSMQSEEYGMTYASFPLDFS